LIGFPLFLWPAQVTKRVDTAEGQWTGWNWRTEGDMMVNGAFFVPSGEGMEEIYDKASSTDPKSAAPVDALTQNAGVLGDPRNDAAETGYAGVNYAGVGNGRGGGGGDDGYGYLGMVYANGDGRGRRALPTLPLASSVITLVALGCLRLL